MTDKSVIILTNALRYAGLGALEALSATSKRTIFCHDPSFTDPASRDAFERDWPGTTASAATTPEAIVADAIDQFGCIDSIISNDVSPVSWGQLEDGDATEFRESIEMLLVWPYRLIVSAAHWMKTARRGQVVFVTSAAASRPEPGFLHYSVARAAASAMAISVAKELAPFGIQVNAIAPNFLRSAEYYPDEVWTTPEREERLPNLLPAGRLGEPKEIGQLIKFLVSGKSNFMTGQVIDFSGGWS